jgi:hypothetical protein
MSFMAMMGCLERLDLTATGDAACPECGPGQTGIIDEAGDMLVSCGHRLVLVGDTYHATPKSGSSETLAAMIFAVAGLSKEQSAAEQAAIEEADRREGEADDDEE